MKKILPYLFIAGFVLFSCSNHKTNSDNPLMIEFTTPLQAVPFDKIDTTHYLPAFEAAIQEARSGLDRISNAPDEPDFTNTVEALEQLNYNLQRLSLIFFNINSAETSKPVQRIAQEISPMLTDYYNDITLNENLFNRVKRVFSERENMGLDTEEQKLLEDTYKQFVRNGANLSRDEKEEYRKLTTELSMLTLKFEENLLDETNAYKMLLAEDKDLSGLPEYVREAAMMDAKAQGLTGWLITLKAPSYQAFMKFSDNRKLREELYRAYNRRGFQLNETDNQEVIRKIVNLRLRLAKLLGYETYADYVLEERMAQNPSKVNAFLEELLTASKPAAIKELSEVQEYADKHGAHFKLQRWDWAYYSEKLKNERFSYTDEMIKPYFRLEQVEKGIFDLANKLYGITLQSDTTIPVYNPEVKTYRVFDEDGTYLALLYVDYFPRESKQGGAWMTNYLDQHRLKGEDIRPHVSLVLNFTKPTESMPSLLTYDEVRTYLHEFGHALHSIFSECKYASNSGTSVYRDFVELPSQIMENWAEEKEWLSLFAFHYKTGEKIPDELLDNVIKSRNFNVGYAFVRQIGLGMNDMAWHTIADSLEMSVAAFENASMTAAELFQPAEGCNISTGFHHIFGGGYAAGYYGYKWAEVLDADAFSVFKEKGIFDKATARSFRDHILSRGGTEKPMDLYVRFRGKEPEIEPLLSRSGLKSDK